MGIQGLYNEEANQSFSMHWVSDGHWHQEAPSWNLISRSHDKVFLSFIWIQFGGKFSCDGARATSLKYVFRLYVECLHKVVTARVCQSSSKNEKIANQGMDCFCLLFVIDLRWFDNVRRGAVNPGAMHFTSLHALIKAATSVGHTKGGSYLHTHAKKKNTHISTLMHTHTHLWQHNNWAYISWIWVTGTQSVRILWCVIRLLDFLECSAIQEGNFRLAKSYQGNHLASMNVYYRFAQDPGCDTISMLYPNLPKYLYSFMVFNLYSLRNAYKSFFFLFILSISSLIQCNQHHFNLHHQGTDYTLTHTCTIWQIPLISAPFFLL